MTTEAKEAVNLRELIFEIGTEELPSESVYRGLEQLKEKASKLLTEKRLSFSSLNTFATPRRLVLSVEGLSERQAPQTTKVKGPSLKAAFDQDGNPTAAAKGFAASQGVEVSDLETTSAEGGTYLFLLRKEEESTALEMLPELLIELIKSLQFSKPMRWQVESNLTFPRPIRWLLAFLDDEPIDLTFGELKSASHTFGHRILSGGRLKVSGVKDYFTKIKAAKVVLDPNERKRMIEEGIADLLQAGERAKINPKTLSEVINLVEYPSVILAEFSKDYLFVPKPVLTTAMESHQRYFPIEEESGRLKSKFILVHNGDPAAIERIKTGHERVIGARLADAKFFYREDIKKPLSENIDKLKTVVFQLKLGSVYEKSLRIERLVEVIAKSLKMDDLIPKAKRAAMLCKADLVSEMVVEFPDLQGVMGKEYAVVSGEGDEVALAILEHYLPKNVEGELPKTDLGAILSMADKIDTIVGCFAVGLIPSGSQDPYALRRQTQGIVAILLDKNLQLAPVDLIDEALRLYEAQGIKFSTPKEEARSKAIEFFYGRIKQHFTQEGYASDIIDAALPTDLGRLDQIEAKIELLALKRDDKEVSDIAVAHTRCKNLSKIDLGTNIESSLFTYGEEKELASVILDLKPKAAKAAGEGDYDMLLNLLAGLKGPVDSFFEAVLVMDKDEKIKENRIRLLNLAVEVFEIFADFSKLIVSTARVV